MSMPHPLPISFREEALCPRQEIINTPKWRRCSTVLPQFGNQDGSNSSSKRKSRSSKKRKQHQMSASSIPSSEDGESPSKKSKTAAGLPLLELQTEKGLRIVNPDDLHGQLQSSFNHHSPSSGAAAVDENGVKNSPDHSDADDSTTSIDGLDSLPGSPDRLLREQEEEEEKEHAAAMMLDDDGADTDEEEEESEEDISYETLWARHDYCMWEMRYQNARALLLSSRKTRRVRQQNTGGTPRAVGRPPNSGRGRRGRSLSSPVADDAAVSPLSLPSADPGTGIPSVDAGCSASAASPSSPDASASQLLPVNSSSPKHSSPRHQSRQTQQTPSSHPSTPSSSPSSGAPSKDPEIDHLMVRPVGRDKYLLEYLKDYEPNPMPDHLLEPTRFNYQCPEADESWEQPRFAIRYLGPKPIPRVHPLPSWISYDDTSRTAAAETWMNAEGAAGSVEAPASLDPVARREFQRRKHLLLRVLHLQLTRDLKTSREQHLKHQLRLAAELKSRKKAAAEIVKKELLLQQQQMEKDASEEAKLDKSADGSAVMSSIAISSSSIAAIPESADVVMKTESFSSTRPIPAIGRPRIVSVAAAGSSASSLSSSSTLLKLELSFIPSKMESGNDRRSSVPLDKAGGHHQTVIAVQQ